LDANVAAEQAKRAGIAADYLKQLSDAARQAGQDRVANTLKVLGIQQDAAAAQARTAYEQASLGLRADTANQSAALRAADLNATQRYHDQQAKALAAYHDGQLSLSQYNAETSRLRAREAAAHNAALERQARTKAATSPKIIGSDRVGRFKLNADGSVTKLDIPTVKTPGKSPSGLTPSQTLDKQGTAAHFANTSFWGVTDKDGAYHPPLHYQEAMEKMRQNGIPLRIAQQALNRWWSVPGFEADPASRQAAYDPTTGSGDAGKVVWDRATAGRGRPLRSYQQRRRGRRRGKASGS
jgi:hypothetical protein